MSNDTAVSTEVIRPERERVILRHRDAKVNDSADQLQASYGTIVHTLQEYSSIDGARTTAIRGLTPAQARELATHLNEMADIAEAQS